jgi:hypothetical protein
MIQLLPLSYSLSSFSALCFCFILTTSDGQPAKMFVPIIHPGFTDKAPTEKQAKVRTFCGECGRKFSDAMHQVDILGHCTAELKLVEQVAVLVKRIKQKGRNDAL